jgi:hypothetical protein
MIILIMIITFLKIVSGDAWGCGKWLVKTQTMARGWGKRNHNRPALLIVRKGETPLWGRKIRCAYVYAHLVKYENATGVITNGS